MSTDAAPTDRSVRAITALVILASLAGCTGPSDETLVVRAQKANPRWENYIEDLKAQLGAGPTAQWDGHPIQATRENDAVTIRFKLRGPWANRAFGIPILIRDPRGQIILSANARPDAGDLLYHFTLTSTNTNLPWIHLKHPKGEIRMVFDPSGQWTNP